MSEKRVHWTQRPENKKRLKKQIRMAARVRALNRKKRLKEAAKLMRDVKKGKLVVTEPSLNGKSKQLVRSETDGDRDRVGSQAAYIESAVAAQVGFCQASIQAFAHSIGVPSKTLTYRVGKLLQLSASGGVHGPGV